MKLIKNVLRYPGGKSRAVQFILKNIPMDISELREPMVGGGTVSLAVKQLLPHVKVVINDINYDLICFWKILRDRPQELIAEVKKIRESCKDGRALYERLIENAGSNDFEKAVRFFVLNRITFSGTVESGGYSQHAFEERFTISAIEKLRMAANIVKDFEITCGDYEELLFREGKNVFIFLDPPYCSTAKSRLYGKNGDLHVSFDHKRFAENMKRCEHLWMIESDLPQTLLL
ncbi:MAG: DNA adenine methylase [Candidatus Methanomethylicaceae archaeon]